MPRAQRSRIAEALKAKGNASGRMMDVKEAGTMRLIYRAAIFMVLVLSTALAQNPTQGPTVAQSPTPKPTGVTRDEARKAIQEGNVAWGKARVALDKETFNRIMTPDPDFYVLLSDGRRLNRQQFLDIITAYPPGVTLVRFDTSVLTVEPRGSDWVALIMEKLEFERKTADGKTEHQYSLSITRDGWRKMEGNRWVALFSEQVGQERWRGTPPPLANW